MKTLHLTIIATMIITIGLISSLPGVFAEESITVSTDKPSYQYGENYTISGKVNPMVLDQAISIVILSPNYPHPESLSISPNSDGRYSYTLPLTINDISSANFTVIAQYAGAKNQTSFSYTGLPCNLQSIPVHVYAPIIRGPPAYNPRLLDSSGNAIIGPVKVGQQIQITYTLANGLNCAQPFAYLVQIQDLNGKTVSLSWITGTLLAGQSLNPAQSWTPQHNGTYTAQIFTWQSIDNPNALAPPVSYTFDVEPNSNLTQPSQLVPRILSNCNEGFIHIIKKEDGSTDCVKPDTAQILVQRGWAKEFIQSVTWTNQSTCEGTQVPSGDYRKNIFPVLIMSPNSTATVCVTYNFNSDWQSYPNKDVYPHGILETCCIVHMGGYSSPVSPNKFEVLANPPLFNVTGVYNGSKISVTYKIYAKPDSKGFYNTSVPFDGCLSYPLAVGYDPSEVDATKFHADFDIPCFASIENVDSVNIVSGMTYKEVQFP